MKNIDEIKLPPSDIDAEESLVAEVMGGGFLAYDEAEKTIQNDDAFYNHECKHLWKALRRLRRREEEFHLVTIKDECKKRNNSITSYWLTGLVEKSIGPSFIPNHAKIVWEKHIQREVLRTATKLLNSSYLPIDTTKQILEEHGRYVDTLRGLLPTRNSDISSIAKETVNKIIKGNTLISYNFKPLNEFAGGMTRGEVTVVGGRPGHGKTTLIVNIVQKLIEDGRKVLLINREMNNTEMMRKLIVLESDELTYDGIRQNEIDDKHKDVLKNGVQEKLANKYSKLKMFDNLRLLEEALSEVTKFKPDVVIDDYVQLIQMPGLLERRFQLEQIMNDYKWICKKENCSAILVSQLNREIERRFDPKPKLSDFAESGVIEQTAEAALFVYYPYQYDDEKFSPYSVNIISAKARYGLTGEGTVGFNGNKCKFYISESEALNLA